MFEVTLIVIGVAVGVILAFIWPKAGKWGQKQAASVSKRWTAVRADYDEFSATARAEFERIEEEAEARINELKARYRK